MKLTGIIMFVSVAGESEPTPKLGVENVKHRTEAPNVQLQQY